MKKILLILSLSFVTVMTCFGQDDDNDNNDKIRDKMTEFIQRRMSLSKGEAQKFRPIFLRYFKEWRTTLRENKSDKPLMQLRVAELRIRYRTEFNDIVGENRCNQIYEHQEVFIKEIRRLRQEQLERRPVRRTRTILLD